MGDVVQVGQAELVEWVRKGRELAKRLDAEADVELERARVLRLNARYVSRTLDKMRDRVRAGAQGA